jgi:hypothetical protein
MKILIASLVLLALSACGSQEPAPPAPTASAVPVADITPSLPAPTKAAFAAAYAEGCPKAKKVSTASCKSEGFGKEGFICSYGLGDDNYLRNTARLTPGDGKWVLADPDKACAPGNAS